MLQLEFVRKWQKIYVRVGQKFAVRNAGSRFFEQANLFFKVTFALVKLSLKMSYCCQSIALLVMVQGPLCDRVVVNVSRLPFVNKGLKSVFDNLIPPKLFVFFFEQLLYVLNGLHTIVKAPPYFGFDLCSLSFR